MDGPLRISFLSMIATGAFAIAILSFTGSVWPYADMPGAREHLAFANAATFVTFVSTLVVFASGAVLSTVSKRRWHSNVSNTLAGLLFLVGLIAGGIQITEAMNAWFDASPRMPGSMIARTISWWKWRCTSARTQYAVSRWIRRMA